MDIEHEQRRVNGQADQVLREIEETIELLENKKTQIQEAIAKTEEVLAIASEHGVTAISLGKRHEIVGNERWGRGYSGSLFTHPDARDKRGWPVAWAISEQAGIGAGAGNRGQHQIESGKTLDGVYECTDGKWKRIS